jgi:SAM-dependent methyltransferase
VVSDRDEVRCDAVADSTFGVARPAWLGGLYKVRNVVRQEMIARQLDRHLGANLGRVLDVGAGQGTQSIRLARAGHEVLAVEPDPGMRAACGSPSTWKNSTRRRRQSLRSWRRSWTPKSAWVPPTRTASSASWRT